MAIGKKNQTISITLSKEIVEKLDILAKEDDRSRGYIASKVIEENISKYETKNTPKELNRTSFTKLSEIEK